MLVGRYAGQQCDSDMHIHEGVDEDEFARTPRRRDAMLSDCKLILPPIQVAITGGHLPVAEANGTRCLNIPLNLA